VSGTLNEETARTTRGEIYLGPWAAYAACALALLRAGVSFYWAAGGTAGLSTIGGSWRSLAGPANRP
jgi:hypothetical protein